MANDQVKEIKAPFLFHFTLFNFPGEIIFDKMNKAGEVILVNRILQCSRLFYTF